MSMDHSNHPSRTQTEHAHPTVPFVCPFPDNPLASPPPTTPGKVVDDERTGRTGAIAT